MRLQGDRSLVEVGNVASVAYTNLNVSYAIPKLKGVTLFLNVRNLFDKQPPPAGLTNQGLPGISGDGWALGDDVVGRYFTVGVRGRL